MKLLSVTNPEQYVTQLTLTATAEELEAGAQATYENTRATLTVRGFKKGEANREQIEADRGEHVFWYDAINDIMDRDVPAIYDAVVAEQGLDVVNEPAYDLVSVKKDEGFTATVSFCTLPEVTVSQYTGFTADCVPNIVTDAEVENFVERKRRLASELVPHKGPAVKGNIVHLTYIGFIDGKAFAGGQAEKKRMELGKSHMIPGFEEAVIGHCAGDAFDIEVTFPENYGKKEVAGKAAVFKAKLEDTCIRQYPALNADFAKKMGDFNTIEEYRADVRAQLEKMKLDNAMNRARTMLVNQLAPHIEGYIPEPLLAQAYATEIQQLQQMLQNQNINMHQFLQQIKKTKEEFTEQVRKASAEKVRISYGLLKVAEMENLIPTDEEITADLVKRAERAKKPLEDIEKTIDRKLFKRNEGRKRAADFVKEHSTIVQKDPAPTPKV